MSSTGKRKKDALIYNGTEVSGGYHSHAFSPKRVCRKRSFLLYIVQHVELSAHHQINTHLCLLPFDMAEKGSTGESRETEKRFF